MSGRLGGTSGCALVQEPPDCCFVLAARQSWRVESGGRGPSDDGPWLSAGRGRQRLRARGRGGSDVQATSAGCIYTWLHKQARVSGRARHADAVARPRSQSAAAEPVRRAVRRCLRQHSGARSARNGFRLSFPCAPPLRVWAHRRRAPARRSRVPLLNLPSSLSALRCASQAGCMQSMATLTACTTIQLDSTQQNHSPRHLALAALSPPAARSIGLAPPSLRAAAAAARTDSPR